MTNNWEDRFKAVDGTVALPTLTRLIELNYSSPTPLNISLISNIVKTYRVEER